MSPSADEVCMNCSDLDLHGIFGGDCEMEDEFISRKSDASVRWEWEQGKDCQFCDFIQKCSAFRTVIYDPPELDADLEPRWLRREKFKWFEFKKEEVILRLVFEYIPTDETWWDNASPSTYLPHSLIGCNMSDQHPGVENRSGSIRVISPYITSFDDLRKRVKTCQDSHSCMQGAGDGLAPLSIPNLLLIDCATRQVVTAPDRCWYLALSYVWGNQKPRFVNIGEQLSGLPQTIDDAITVTSKLGFQYLWVDMYCIKQDNQIDVDNQVRHMDLVYRRAQATIIAAAGSNPEFGLPGVSTMRQTRQAYATMNGIYVANFTHNPWELVDSSVWNSRGWTFQESFFSPRRIFFTEEQTIFNCSYGWTCESIGPIQPCALLDNVIGIRNRMIRRIPPTFSNQSLGNMVYPLIRKYSHRHLTFSKDILKAFSGVLHACENLISPVRHFWGIPILPQENLVLESFNLGLSWDFSEIVILARLSRREGFPSWSWSGWDHPVSYREWYATRRKFFSPPELNVAIEIADGPTMSWIDIKQAVILGKHHLSRTKLLKVEAWTTMVKLRFITGAAEKPEDLASTTFTWAYASFCSEEYAWMVRAQVPILVNGADLNTWKDGRHTYALCTGILLGGIEKDDNQVDHPLLLVTKKGEFWERIGITYLIESFQMAPWRKEQKPVEKWIRYWLQIQREVIYLI